MPPRTDCSAGISCGGFRLPSELRVPSSESRCVTDKAAVLRCAADAAGKPFILPGTVLWSFHRAAYIQVYQWPLTTRTGRAERVSAARAGVIPTIHKLSTEDAGSAKNQGLRGGPTRRRRRSLAPQKQVFRNGSRPRPSLQASSHRSLWITCALHGVACAQPVHDPVDTKKL